MTLERLQSVWRLCGALEYAALPCIAYCFFCQFPKSTSSLRKNKQGLTQYLLLKRRGLALQPFVSFLIAPSFYPQSDVIPENMGSDVGGKMLNVFVETFSESKCRGKVSALAVRKRIRLHALSNRVTDSMLRNMTLPRGADQRDPQILCDVMC